MHLSTNAAVLQTITAQPWTFALGFPKKPTVEQWRETKTEVERLVGYEVANWGSFTNPNTGWFWTEAGNTACCDSGTPPMEELLARSTG
jgi:hypothetical protein